MFKNNYKTIVVLGVMFFVISVIALLLGNIQKSKDQKNMENPVLENDSSIVTVTNKSSFLTIANCMEQFIFNYKQLNSEIILNLYTTEYAKKNDLNLDNVLSNSLLKDVDLLYKINEAYVSEGDEVSTFYVLGVVYNDTKTENIYNKIILDYSNGSYGIEFISEKEYYDIIDNNEVPDQTYIIPNNYNKFEVTTVTDMDLCALYLSDYKYNIKHNVNLAYNIIEDNTKNEYFPTVEDFKKYIDDNYLKIKNSYLSKYQVYNDNNKSNYVCVDNNNITYEFYENSILKYTMAIVGIN